MLGDILFSLYLNVEKCQEIRLLNASLMNSQNKREREEKRKDEEEREDSKITPTQSH